jgi:tetratricopeptide (TPR) repeat protein
MTNSSYISFILLAIIGLVFLIDLYLKKKNKLATTKEIEKVIDKENSKKKSLVSAKILIPILVLAALVFGWFYFNVNFGYKSKTYVESTSDEFEEDWDTEIEVAVEEEVDDRSIDEFKNKAEYYVYKANSTYVESHRLAYLSKAIEIDPYYAEAYKERGGVYMRVVDWINDDDIKNWAKNNDINYIYKAIDNYSSAIEINPADAETYFCRGRAYVKLKNYNEAIADYSRAIRIDDDFFIWRIGEHYLSRGWLYHDSGNFNEAIADFSSAIRINPDEYSLYYGRGNAYFELGSYNEAIADFSSAIRLQPDFYQYYEARAKAKEKAGLPFCSDLKKVCDFCKKYPWWSQEPCELYNKKCR